MPELLQHIIVTLVALAAAAVVFRRVAGVMFTPRRSSTPCANCPSAAQHQVKDGIPASSSAKPLTLVRR
jgi:hypothetical protein